MSSEEIKNSLFSFSATGIAIVSTILATAGGTIYVGITTYNRVIAATEAIENFKQYDDGEIKKYIISLQNQNTELKTELAAVKDTLLSNANTTTRLSESTSKSYEKASEATTTAIEAKTIAVSNSRETQMSLVSIRDEIKATKDALEDKMKALQRATTNPLGK
jgi:hypothetical protein